MAVGTNAADGFQGDCQAKPDPLMPNPTGKDAIAPPGSDAAVAQW